MFFKKNLLVITVMVLLGVIAAACGTAQPETITVVETVVVEKEVQGETITVVETVEVEKVVEVEKEVEKIVEVAPVDPDVGRITLDSVIGTEPPSLDPALGTDTTSIFFIRQLFVGLLGFDEDANVVSSLATDWSVSDDGLVWTFNLRDDVQWVHRDPTSGEFSEMGPVTAQDVVYGINRTLDPNTASDYAYVLYPIQGAEEFNTADPGAEDFEDIKAGLGVSAPDETTVEITLHTAAAYFPSIAAMWVTYPQPQAAIEQWGDNWTEAGLIVTSGPYTL
ncbi:MAG TPA: ABC transporter substrate-binding protein, partial [Anaerolineae bacterium]